MLPPSTVVAYLSFTSGQGAGENLALHSFDHHNDSKADNNRLKSPETAEKQGRDSKHPTKISKRQEGRSKSSQTSTGKTEE